jgi:hypothetical protein
MIPKTKMTMKRKTFIHIITLYFFNVIYTSETRKTGSSIKCVLSLKSRLRAVHGLLALLYIVYIIYFIYILYTLSLEISSLDIKVKENTWIESSITPLLTLFKFILDILTLTPKLLAGLGNGFDRLANLEYFLYKKWGMELTPYQRSACTSLTNLEVGLWCDNNKHVCVLELAQQTRDFILQCKL